MRKILGSDILSEDVINKALESITFADTADASTTQEALATLGAGVRPNLGDNCDFTDPINQKGVTSWSVPSGDVPIFDRWKIQATEGGVEAGLESGGLKLSMTAANQGIKQDHVAGALLPRKVYTSSVMVDGKLYSAEIVPEEGTGMVAQYPGTEFHCAITFSAGQCQWYPYIDYRFTSRTVTIARCKLENNRGQTLGYMDADGTWKLLPQPDSKPGQMLAECQRYLYSPYYGAFPTAPIGTVFVSNQTTGFVAINTPALMRTKPVFSGDPSKLWIVKSNGGGAQRPSALSVIGMSGCGVLMAVTASFGADGQYIMYSEDISNPSDFILSAEL